MSIRAGRTVRLAITITWIGLLGITLALLIGSRVASLTGRSVLIVRGASMEPQIPLGSVVVTEPVDPASLAASDVITFRTGSGAVVTHRIVQVYQIAGEFRFETRGDANATPDPVLTTGSEVVGRAVFWVPLAGFALAYLSVPGGFLSCLSMIGMLFLLGWLLDLLSKAPNAAPSTSAPSQPSAAST